MKQFYLMKIAKKISTTDIVDFKGKCFAHTSESFYKTAIPYHISF